MAILDLCRQEWVGFIRVSMFAIRWTAERDGAGMDPKHFRCVLINITVIVCTLESHLQPTVYTNCSALIIGQVIGGCPPELNSGNSHVSSNFLHLESPTVAAVIFITSPSMANDSALCSGLRSSFGRSISNEKSTAKTPPFTVAGSTIAVVDLPLTRIPLNLS